jgi:uncharacterized protein YegP (UPF0339 family)
MDFIKQFIKKLLAYFSANPAFAFVVIACCVFIAILLVVVVTLVCKTKKAQKLLAEQPTQPDLPTATPVEQTETTETIEPVENTETVEPTKEVETIETTETVEEAEPTKTTETVKEETVVEEKLVEKTEKAVNKAKKEEKTKKEPVKKAPNKRYNGKWTIWRLITKDENLGADHVEEAYFFELLASNGEKLLSSEEYTSYNGAVKGIETHKTNILKNNFRIGLSKKGEYIFKLLTGKNTLLCTGENYPTKLRCENAIESTKRFAQTAVLDENVHDLVVQIPLDTEEETVEYDQTILGKWIISKMSTNEGDEFYYFELFASNGEKLLASEEYTSYSGALNGINTHKNNIEKDNFRISLTKRGDYIYKLLTSNGQLLCLGEHYKTRRRCESAVESVKRFAKNSPVLTAANVVPKD